ncbi:MAG TPA: galactose-1-phosphate uridylyltransferase [Streptosporangiales bacterium]
MSEQGRLRRVDRRLADGREIVYFDERDLEHFDDERDLPERVSHTEVRFDPLQGEWVAIASHRQTRTYLPPADECPLCPSRDGRHTEVPSPDYDVAVFENRFPSFVGVAKPAASERSAAGGLFVRRDGVGRCEVVCFTSDHDTSFYALPPRRVRTVIDAWVDRTEALGAQDGVEHVFPFENRGKDIGVTLHHPHGQIYGYPFVPPFADRMLGAARVHAEDTGRNLFADLLAAEQADGSRVVLRTDHWTAFVPYAARWPVEVHLFPHRQVPDLPALDDAERDDLARAYLDLLGRLERLYDQPLPYVAGIHQAPVREYRDVAYLHLRVHSVMRSPGKLKYLAGSESGMGAFVSDVRPEDVAARLRELQ